MRVRDRVVDRRDPLELGIDLTFGLPGRSTPRRLESRAREKLSVRIGQKDLAPRCRELLLLSGTIVVQDKERIDHQGYGAHFVVGFTRWHVEVALLQVP